MFGLFAASEPIEINFGWKGLRGVTDTEKRLNTVSEEEKISFLVQLLHLWKVIGFTDTGGRMDKFSELMKLFGNDVSSDELIMASVELIDFVKDGALFNWHACYPLLGRNLLFTHNTSFRRFACWYAVPDCSFGNCGVASGRGDYLFSCTGSKRQLAPFKKALIPANFGRGSLPDGTALWMEAK